MALWGSDISGGDDAGGVGGLLAVRTHGAGAGTNFGAKFVDRSKTLLGLDYLPGKGVAGSVINPASFWQASTAPQEFKSFEQLKKALGPAGEGKQWHHIVEQHDFNIAKFGPQAIHNVDNVVPISAELNQKLNAIYSAPLPSITGSSLTVREWLKTKTLQQNYDFGRAALHYVSEGVW